MNSSCIPDNKEFHSPSQAKDQPFLYCVLPHSVDRVSLAEWATPKTSTFTSLQNQLINFRPFVIVLLPNSHYHARQQWKWSQRNAMASHNVSYYAAIRRATLRSGLCRKLPLKRSNRSKTETRWKVSDGCDVNITARMAFHWMPFYSEMYIENEK